MSQAAVEQVLGRMITDERFRLLATESLETACLQEGYQLFPEELRLLSGLDLHCVAEFAGRLDPGLCRARTASD
ncbi:MAG: Os1348 family NHLP clan protein [Geobacteraceae bacterium]